MIKNAIRKIPVVGMLADVRGKSVASATYEIFITTLFSTLPIWFFPTVYTLFFVDSPGFYSNILESVSQGDLYVYSSSLIGPLVFAITYSYGTWNSEYAPTTASKIGNLAIAFPYGSWFLVISLIIAMTSVFCFGFTRFTISGFILAKLNREALLLFSAGLYAFSLVLLFIVSIYKADLTEMSANDGSETSNFVDEWNNRNG